MANGQELNDELEFRQHISALKDRELIEFTALQSYKTCTVINNHEQRITSLEKRDRKAFGMGSGIGASISTVVYTILYFITGKGSM